MPPRKGKGQADLEVRVRGTMDDQISPVITQIRRNLTSLEKAAKAGGLTLPAAEPKGDTARILEMISPGTAAQAQFQKRIDAARAALARTETRRAAGVPTGGAELGRISGTTTDILEQISGKAPGKAGLEHQLRNVERLRQGILDLGDASKQTAGQRVQQLKDSAAQEAAQQRAFNAQEAERQRAISSELKDEQRLTAAREAGNVAARQRAMLSENTATLKGIRATVTESQRFVASEQRAVAVIQQRIDRVELLKSQGIARSADYQQAATAARNLMALQEQGNVNVQQTTGALRAQAVAYDQLAVSARTAERHQRTFGFGAIERTFAMQRGFQQAGSAAQGFMLATAALDKNIVGLGFSLIFLQFSMLPIALTFAALGAAGTLLVRHFMDLRKQAATLRAMGTQLLATGNASMLVADAMGQASMLVAKFGFEMGDATKAVSALVGAGIDLGDSMPTIARIASATGRTLSDTVEAILRVIRPGEFTIGVDSFRDALAALVPVAVRSKGSVEDLTIADYEWFASIAQHIEAGDRLTALLGLIGDNWENLSDIQARLTDDTGNLTDAGNEYFGVFDLDQLAKIAAGLQSIGVSVGGAETALDAVGIALSTLARTEDWGRALGAARNFLQMQGVDDPKVLEEHLRTISDILATMTHFEPIGLQDIPFKKDAIEAIAEGLSVDIPLILEESDRWTVTIRANIDEAQKQFDLLSSYYTERPILTTVTAAFQTDPTTLGVLDWVKQLDMARPYTLIMDAFVRAHPELAEIWKNYIAHPDQNIIALLEANLAPGSTIQSLMDELDRMQRDGIHIPITYVTTSGEPAIGAATATTRAISAQNEPGGALGDITPGYTYVPPQPSATIIQGLSNIFNINGVLPSNFEDVILGAVSKAILQAGGVKPAGHP